MFEGLGCVLWRRRWWVLAVSVLLTVLVGWWGVGVFGAVGGGGYDNPESESSRAQAAIEAQFGREHVVDVTVLYRDPDGSTVDDPQFPAQVAAALDAADADAVAQVVSYWSPRNTDPDELVSFDRTATTVLLTFTADTEAERLAAYQLIADDLRADGLETYLGGSLAALDQLNTAAGSDLTAAELIALPALLVLLIVLLGGVVAGLLPLMGGIIAILGAMAILRGISSVTDVSIFALNIATLLGLGLAIDYGLFTVTRFREELAAGRDVPTAVRRTIATAGRTVLFSGLVIAIAFAGMLLFPTAALRSIGWGGLAVVTVDVLAALIVLPAVLAILGHRVNALPMPWRRRQPFAASNDDGRWAGFGRFVMRRPVLWLVGVGAVLLVAGSPILGLQPGTVNHRHLPAGSDDLQVVAITETDFATGGGYYVEIAITGSPQPTPLAEYADAAANLPGAVSAHVADTAPGLAHVRVGMVGEPDTTENLDLIRDLRALPPPAGADEVFVGGHAAATLDGIEALTAIAPLALGLVAAGSFVVLFLALGSLVLPLKALLTAALSLGACSGVIVWGIQNGGLAGILGFTPAGTTDLGNLLLVLLIVFGLATDYELFLLSRVREEYLTTGDNTGAVATGLQRTGTIITSAALLFGVVTAVMGLTATGLVLLAIGVGMTVAIFVDATLVRMILVPVTMKLLGDRNWWLPRPLRRLHDRIGLTET